MRNPCSKLNEMTVEQAMQRNVVTVAASQTMHEAASILRRHGISGAPVVDEVGRCVGIVSAADFLALEDARQQADETAAHGTGIRLDTTAPNGGWILDFEPLDLVERHMTPAVQTIDPSDSLANAATVMCGGQLHRLIVLDDQSHPVGVITPMDILAVICHLPLESRREEHG